jgi:hypothetical protein
MTDINISNYYFKAENVLFSCTNLSQVKNSLNYIKLYYRLTGDYCGYTILVRKYHKLLNELTTND